MGEGKESWESVGEQFAALGRRLREGADKESMEQALHGLAGAVDQLVDSVAGAVRDPGFKEDAKQAARSLGDAITETVRGLKDRGR